MRCTLTHRGVPLVAVDFETGETMLEIAPAALLSGYRHAAEARVSDGRRAEDKLRSLEQELELRDYTGALVPTDSIHVTELSLARPDVVTVFVQLRETHAPVSAVEPPTARLAVMRSPCPSTEPSVASASAGRAEPKAGT